MAFNLSQFHNIPSHTSDTTNFFANPKINYSSVSGMKENKFAHPFHEFQNQNNVEIPEQTIKPAEELYTKSRYITTPLSIKNNPYLNQQENSTAPLDINSSCDMNIPSLLDMTEYHPQTKKKIERKRPDNFPEVVQHRLPQYTKQLQTHLPKIKKKQYRNIQQNVNYNPIGNSVKATNDHNQLRQAFITYYSDPDMIKYKETPGHDLYVVKIPCGLLTTSKYLIAVIRNYGNPRDLCSINKLSKLPWVSIQIRSIHEKEVETDLECQIPRLKSCPIKGPPIFSTKITQICEYGECTTGCETYTVEGLSCKVELIFKSKSSSYNETGTIQSAINTDNTIFILM
jgi:hypothetical protein